MATAVLGRTLQRFPMASMFLLLLLSTSLCSMASGAQDLIFCNVANIPGVTPAPPRPTFTQSFSMRVECNFMDRNQSVDVMEYFDAKNNRAAMYVLNGGKKTQAIFDYGTNELITLKYPNSGGPPACTVDNLVKSSMKFLFGDFQTPNHVNHIYSAAQALRFGGNITEKYIGQLIVREGIKADAWESCLYWSEKDITMKLTWYFTASSGAWISPMAVIQPVQLDVNGIDHSKGTSRKFSHTYIFVDYHPSLPDIGSPIKAFETPPGTYCQDRATTKNLPNITSYFSYSAEIVKPLENYVNYIKEYYNYDTNLVRYDFRPDRKAGGSGNLITHLHDFNTGVGYSVDPMIGSCYASPLSTDDFDSKVDKAIYARMRTRKEFFDFDSSLYQYVERRVVSGIECDVWATRKNDFPLNNPLPMTIWEWYFATPQEIINYGMKVESVVPVMLQITSYPTMNIIYNIYEYTEDPPKIWEVDISACYNYTQRKSISFTLPGTYQHDVAANLWSFKLSLVQAIVTTVQISPVRINSLSVDYDNAQNVLVSFVMLDKAPIQGDSDYKFTDLPLSQTAPALTTAINSGQFVVLLNPKDFPNITSLTAHPYSVTQTSHPHTVAQSGHPHTVVQTGHPHTVAQTGHPQTVAQTGHPHTVAQTSHPHSVSNIQNGSSGYSGGAMAGLAIGMIVLGIIIACAALFLVYKMRGRFSKLSAPFSLELNKYNHTGDD